MGQDARVSALSILAPSWGLFPHWRNEGGTGGFCGALCSHTLGGITHNVTPLMGSLVLAGKGFGVWGPLRSPEPLPPQSLLRGQAGHTGDLPRSGEGGLSGLLL